MNTINVSLELRAISIKSQVSIFKALEFIGVHLLHGHSTQQILCPFHDDSKPSARAYGDTNKVFCFTCHKLWDPITVVMESKRLDFPQTVTLIEEAFNLSSPAENLPLTVKYNLEKEQTKDGNLHYLAAYVEERVIEVRFTLGLHQYLKLLTVIDLMNFHLQSKKVSNEEYKGTMRKILSKLPANV